MDFHLHNAYSTINFLGKLSAFTMQTGELLDPRRVQNNDRRENSARLAVPEESTQQHWQEFATQDTVCLEEFFFIFFVFWRQADVLTVIRRSHGRFQR